MTWHKMTGSGAEFPRPGQRVVVRVNGKEREAVFRWRETTGYRFDPPERKLVHGIANVREWREA
jgi:hypothetical protein